MSKLESILDLTVRQFLPLFHKALTQSTYYGIPILKNPLDLFIYQEIIHATKPDVIIEIGTYKGGSAKALRDMLRIIDGDKPMVVTIDKVTKAPRFNDGIYYMCGSATDRGIIDTIVEIIEYRRHTTRSRIMVIDDGSHTYDDVLANLNLYSPLVTVGLYYIVEDSICHKGLNIGPVPGPADAIETFLRTNAGFVPDSACERFCLTYNPGGYLLRIK